MVENKPTAPTVTPQKTSGPPPVPAKNGNPVSSRPEIEPSRSPASSPLLWVVIVLVVIGLVAALLISKNAKKPVAKAPPPVTISVTNAIKGNIDETVWALGTVTPIYTAMISPRVDGQLIKVNYTEGQMVTTNDMLAEIDPGPYQALLTQAEGQLARDKALLEGANIDLARFQDAYGKGYGTNLHAIPKQQVDDQVALVHQDEGTVKYDEGQVANAKVQLAYCYIHAPIAGRVGLRLVDPGNVVHAANTNALVVITQLQPITVVFTVDQKHLPEIQKQLKSNHTMTVEAYNEEKTQILATGKFQTLDNLIDTGTGTVRIKAIFDNKDGSLFPNQFVNAKLITETLHDVTLIPESSVQRNPQGAFVYMVTNKEITLTNATGPVGTNVTVVAMRAVTPGITDAEITSVEGLEPGETIATDNFNKLGEGTRVNVRQTGAEGQKGGPPGERKKGHKKDQAKSDAP